MSCVPGSRLFSVAEEDKILSVNFSMILEGKAGRALVGFIQSGLERFDQVLLVNFQYGLAHKLELALRRQKNRSEC